jgi:hypothetical protein
MTMKNDPFSVVAKYLKPGQEKAEQTGAADPVWADPNIVSTRIEDGEIVAVQICSTVLEVHIWISFDDAFDPPDRLAVFYGHELEHLKNKTPDQLRKIHKDKLQLGPGSRVRQ